MLTQTQCQSGHGPSPESECQWCHRPPGRPACMHEQTSRQSMPFIDSTYTNRRCMCKGASVCERPCIPCISVTCWIVGQRTAEMAYMLIIKQGAALLPRPDYATHAANAAAEPQPAQQRAWVRPCIQQPHTWVWIRLLFQSSTSDNLLGVLVTGASTCTSFQSWRYARRCIG